MKCRNKKKKTSDNSCLQRKYGSRSMSEGNGEGGIAVVETKHCEWGKKKNGPTGLPLEIPCSMVSL